MKRAEEIIRQMLMEKPKDVWTRNGLQCVVWRHPSLFHYCGYVGTNDKSSPMWKMNYNNFYDKIGDIEVHWGLTFSGFLTGDENKVWSVGFDCTHSGDINGSDCLRAMTDPNPIWNLDPNARYRSFEWVKKETESLCDQIYKLLNKEQSNESE